MASLRNLRVVLRLRAGDERVELRVEPGEQVSVEQVLDDDRAVGGRARSTIARRDRMPGLAAVPSCPTVCRAGPGSRPAAVRHDVRARPARPARPKGHGRGARSGDPGRHDRRRHRRRPVLGRRRHRRRAHHRGRRPARRRAHDRRRRRRRRAGLGRRPHPLRRPGHLGRPARPVVRQRRHHAGDGQLRRRLRALPARRAGHAHRADGGRRGHPRQRAARRRAVGRVGDLPRVPRLPRLRVTTRSTSRRSSRTDRSGST